MKRTLLSLLRLVPVLAVLGVSGCTAPQSTGSKTSATGVKPYPFKTCLVSGNTLGSMGDPIIETYEGREVRFCCEPCVKKFHKNPGKYLTKLPS